MVDSIWRLSVKTLIKVMVSKYVHIDRMNSEHSLQVQYKLCFWNEHTFNFKDWISETGIADKWPNEFLRSRYDEGKK